MKDEEMAEEYRKSLKQRLIDEDDFERLEKFDENVEDAFLAGLKAGRPQWHDLRKDPNDLPKEGWNNSVIAVYDCVIGTRFQWCRARREKCVDGIYWLDRYSQTIENVVMWAKIEIPTSDKE